MDQSVSSSPLIRSTRNAIMHSSTMELSDKQFRECIDPMVELLFDGLADNPDALEAIQKLVRLRDGNLFEENVGQCPGVLTVPVYHKQEGNEEFPAAIPKLTRSSRQKRDKILYECLHVSSNTPIKEVESSRGCLSAHLKSANDTEDAQPAQKGENEEEGNFQMSAAGKLTYQPQGLDQNPTENIRQNEMENLTPENSLSFKGCFHCIYGLKPPNSILPEGAMGTTKQLIEVQESSGNDTVPTEMMEEGEQAVVERKVAGGEVAEAEGGERKVVEAEGGERKVAEAEGGEMTEAEGGEREVAEGDSFDDDDNDVLLAGAEMLMEDSLLSSSQVLDTNFQPTSERLESTEDDTEISNCGILAIENGDYRNNLHQEMILEKIVGIERQFGEQLDPSVLFKPALSILRQIPRKESHTIKSRGQRSAGNANCMHLQQMARQMFEPPDIAISPSQFTLGRRTPGTKKGDLILLLYDGLLTVTWIDITKPAKKVILKCTILELKGWLMRLPPRQQDAVCRVLQQFCQALNTNWIQVMDHILDESSVVDVCLPHNQLQQEGGGVSRDDGRHTGLYFTESHDRAAMTQWIACLTQTESRDESRDKVAIARLTLNPETSGCSAITAVSPSAEQRQMVEDAEIVKWSSTKTFRDMVGSCQFQFPPTIITVGRVQCTEDLIKEQQQEWRECVVPSGQRHVQRNTANHCFNAVLPLPDLPARVQAHPDVGGIREYVIVPSGQQHVQQNTANHCFNAVLPLPDLPVLA